MNILLLKGYTYYDKDGNLCAEEENDILKLYRPSLFKDIMYDMTYKLKGTKCIYCGKKANSMDHGYPQDFGGPTITNNLYPTCKLCNNKKANMLREEYSEYLEITDKEKRAEFMENLKQIQKDRREGLLDDFPKEWISEKRFSVITVKFYIEEPLGSKYRRFTNYLNTHNRHKNGIVLSSNGVVLDGFNIILVGKVKGRSDYNQHILENVLVVN